MKRLLLPLLAALALPTAVNAESVWLILEISANNARSLTKIEMRDMTQCEEVAQKWLNTKKINTKKNLRGYECLEGK